MKIFRNIPELATVADPVSLAIGVFDGLHLGHRAVIHSAIQEAQSTGGKTVVVTFEPHPIRILRPEKAPKILASLPHKAILLDRLGIDFLLAVPFDRVFAQLSADAFIERLMEACRHLSGISVGSDWRFGSGRGGNVGHLAELGKLHEFTVHSIDQVNLDGHPVSSTRIRSAISRGELEQACAMLGRDYTVLGTVVAGRQLGGKIGFPTANLRVLDEQLPPDGVYAVRVLLRGDALIGVANIGVRPTVDGEGSARHFEIHLFDLDKQIYGEELEVTFAGFLRAEKKFPDLESLRQQITEDCREARVRLAVTDP